MALLHDELTLWEISFRWEARDPSAVWVVIPLDVRDHFRVLMQAILSGELDCLTLSLERWQPEAGGSPEGFIRHYIDQVYECIGGIRFNRKLLRWALIRRADLFEWCEHRGVLAPAFWFPPGVKDFPWDAVNEQRTAHERLRYLLKKRRELDDSGRPSLPEVETEIAQLELQLAGEGNGEAEEGGKSVGQHLRPVQQARIACTQIAANLWKENPTMPIAQMARHEIVRRYGGASHYNEDTVTGWLRDVAPAEVRGKRGRPPKKTPGND